MKTANRSNALLMELLIVVMFFMLAAAMLVQVFAKARAVTGRAGLIAAVTARAQSQADLLIAAEDPEAALRSLGYTNDGAGWTLGEADCTFSVTLLRQPDGLTRQELTVKDHDGAVLLTLPCSVWREVRP